MADLTQVPNPVKAGSEDAYMRAVLYCLDANALSPEGLATLLVQASRWDRSAERRLVGLEGGLILYTRYLQVMGLVWGDEYDTLAPPPRAA